MTRDQFIYALTACGCLLKDGKTWYEHNELIKCFEDLGLFEQEPQTFKWCTDCKEYDQEKHCCHRWSKVIRNTVEEMKQEQEPKTGHCKDCKWWKDSDGAYRRGVGVESQCPINRREVFEGNGYCYMFEPQESEEQEDELNSRSFKKNTENLSSTYI